MMNPERQPRPKSAPKHAIHGWINLYKPYGMGSTDAVSAVKRALRPQKIGHAGTLDPLAEGVLPLALGEATKTVPYMMDAIKTYEFTVIFGESRSTNDAEGEVTTRSPHRPTCEEIQRIIPQFTGAIDQVPPIYSALKVQGKRAYDLARAGETPELAARRVKIERLRLIGPYSDGICEQARLEAVCSKGTYIRSLARDMALALGTVGYVGTLKRTAVGSFDLSHAISLDLLQKLVHNPPSLEHGSGDWLLPVSASLDDIPALHVDDAAATQLQRGQAISGHFGSDADVLAAFCEGRLVAVVSRQNGRIAPKRVFNL